jgi:hypothetical protein
MLQGLIDSLDEKSQEQLSKQRETLESFHNGNLDGKDLEQVYKEISCYLHKTYLAEVRYGPTTKFTGLGRLEEKLKH